MPFKERNEGKANNVLDNFIKMYLPSDINLMKSDFKGNYSTKQSNKLQNINDLIDTEVYSYKSESEEQIYTVVSLSFSDKLSISEKDSFEFIVNDYLRPVSPAVCTLYTKESIEHEWKEIKQLVADVNMNGITIYGGEMQNKYFSSRIILSFSAGNNISSQEEFPYYYVKFENHGSDINTISTILISFLILSIILLFFCIRKKKRNVSEN